MKYEGFVDCWALALSVVLRGCFAVAEPSPAVPFPRGLPRCKKAGHAWFLHHCYIAGCHHGFLAKSG
jgi:hypothetical protein